MKFNYVTDIMLQHRLILHITAQIFDDVNNLITRVFNSSFLVELHEIKTTHCYSQMCLREWESQCDDFILSPT